MELRIHLSDISCPFPPARKWNSGGQGWVSVFFVAASQVLRTVLST